MRYYDIRLTNPTTGQIARSWTSHPNGKFDPQSLLVEFDIVTSRFAVPTGLSTVTIYGVSLQDLFQANHFGLFQNALGLFQPSHAFTMLGGMQAGLPLANPKQAGLLVSGVVLQSWGNWEGTDMTLDLQVTGSGGYTISNPASIVLNWTKGTELSVALTNCLKQAFPQYPVKVSIKSGLVQNHDEVGYFSTLDQLGQWLEQLTSQRFNSPVDLCNQGAALFAFDVSYNPVPVQLAYTDLVGQPTWIGPQEMQIKLVMRGDLTIGGLVKLPLGIQDNPGIVQTAAAANASSLRYKSTFSGNFRIQQIRHIGNSRSPDGASWVTVINCVPYA